jgi:hypothetical protein
MGALMGLILTVSGIVSLVCWIMVLIKIFKDNVGLGILGVICGLFAFIYGWVKVKEYDCKNVMVAWSAAMVVSIIANALGGAALFSEIMSMSAG